MENSRQVNDCAKLAFGLLSMLWMAGCSDAPVEEPGSAEVNDNLSVIANAYMQATDEKDQAPQTKEDLEPYLTDGEGCGSAFRIRPRRAAICNHLGNRLPRGNG